jgi:hypothetical protein
MITPPFTTNLSPKLTNWIMRLCKVDKKWITLLLYTKNKTLEISLEGSKLLILLNFFGGTCGGRTHDKRIKSAQLCTTIRYIFNVKKRDKKVVCEF